MSEQESQEAPEKEMTQDEAGKGEEEGPDFLKEELVELDEHEEEEQGSDSEAAKEQAPPEETQEEAAKEADTKEIDDALEEIKGEAHERGSEEKEEAESPERDEKVSAGQKPEEAANEEADTKGAKEKKGGKGRKLLVYGLGFLILSSALVLAAKAFILKEKEGPKEKKIILKPVERLVLEERLEPFFIPLPPKKGKRKRPQVMAYVEVTAKWEKIVSVQFKENKPKVRSDLYWVLVKFMKDSSNPREMKGRMAKALSAAAKKTLGVSNVEMRVESVKVI